jgi:ubiquinone/menaquinone biosynthesis C-methylase UbiE
MSGTVAKPRGLGRETAFVNQVRADLAKFYEHEAASRSRGPATGRRVEWLADCAQQFAAEGSRTVLDVGAGPATDATAFESVGIAYAGIDLAVANGMLAAEHGSTVLAASLFDLPFGNDTFDSGWSMSTLMHVPEMEVGDALREVTRVLRSGAPLMIGQWGGSLGDIDADVTVAGLPRLFSLRSTERNRKLLGDHGTIEHWDVWDAGPEGWEYHIAIIRTT